MNLRDYLEDDSRSSKWVDEQAGRSGEYGAATEVLAAAFSAARLKMLEILERHGEGREFHVEPNCIFYCGVNGFGPPGDPRLPNSGVTALGLDLDDPEYFEKLSEHLRLAAEQTAAMAKEG